MLTVHFGNIWMSANVTFISFGKTGTRRPLPLYGIDTHLQLFNNVVVYMFTIAYML